MMFKIAERAEKHNPFENYAWSEKTIDAKDMTEAKAIAEETRREDSEGICILWNNQTFAEWQKGQGWVYDLGTPKKNIFEEFGF